MRADADEAQPNMHTTLNRIFRAIFEPIADPIYSIPSAKHGDACHALLGAERLVGRIAGAFRMERACAKT